MKCDQTDIVNKKPMLLLMRLQQPYKTNQNIFHFLKDFFGNFYFPMHNYQSTFFTIDLGAKYITGTTNIANIVNKIKAA
jgi:hypothetical protein